MAGNSDYGVPLMPFDDILKLVKQKFDISVSKAELINSADPIVLQDVYYMFLHCLTETVDGLNQPRLSTDLEVTESMDGAVFLLNMFSSMKTLLKKIHFNDFLISDIVQPKPKRTQLILSHLLNFHTFCQSQLGLGEHLQATMEELMNAKESSAAEAPVLQRRIGDATNEITVAKEAVANLESCATERREQIRQKIFEKEELKKTKEALKDKSQTIGTKIASCQVEIDELTTTEQTLQERVAKSPEELERNMAQRRLELVQVKEETSQLRARIEALEASENSHGMWESTISHLLKKMRCIKIEMDRCRESEGHVASKERSRQEMSELLADAVAAHTAHLNELVRLKELEQSLQVQKSAKVKNLKTQIAQANEQKSSFESNLRQNYVVYEYSIEQLDKLKLESAEMERQIVERQQQMKELAARFKEKLEAFYEKVAGHTEQSKRDILAMKNEVESL